MPYNYVKVDDKPIVAIRAYCQKVLPAVYDDSLSYYELVCKIQAKLNEVIEKLNLIDLSIFATKDELEQGLAELDEALRELLEVSQAEQTVMLKAHTLAKISQLKAELEEEIKNAVVGKVQIFDPTYGISTRDVDTVVRRVYHWLRYYADYAKTIDELSKTAKERDDMALEARTFDLYNMEYYSKTELPSPLPPETDEYVKKHDIMAYYFTRKQ